MATEREQANASVTLRGRFPSGAKVDIRPRLSDFFSAGGETVKSATVDKEGNLKVDGLEPMGSYWAVAEIDGTERAVAITAKTSTSRHPDLARDRYILRAQAIEAAESRARQARQAQEKDPLAASPAVGGPDPRYNLVEGARNSTNVPSVTGAGVTFAGSQIGVPTDKEAQEPEPQPHLRQEDLPEDVPQRSATLTGQATPKREEELQPKPSQQDLREGRIEGYDEDSPQRSATERGEATPKDPDETQPSIRQEDVPDNVPQRSDTETGTAEPKPQVDAVENQIRKDGSLEKSLGRTVAKPVEKTASRKTGAKGDQGDRKAQEADKRRNAPRGGTR